MQFDNKPGRLSKMMVQGLFDFELVKTGAPSMSGHHSSDDISSRVSAQVRLSERMSKMGKWKFIDENIQHWFHKPTEVTRLLEWTCRFNLCARRQSCRID